MNKLGKILEDYKEGKAGIKLTTMRINKHFGKKETPIQLASRIGLPPTNHI